MRKHSSGYVLAAKAIVRDLRRAVAVTSLPFEGYRHHLTQTKYVDVLPDADLKELNDLLHWNAFTVDIHGRRFGGSAWSGKRTEPQVIPDPRVLLAQEKFDLSDRHVLEIGCFEGIHTVALGMYAKTVTAVDARIVNVVKTIVRCAMFGYSPTVFKCDVENILSGEILPTVDVVFHVGVLYHLRDPVSHLLRLGKRVTHGILLDTHFGEEKEANEVYEIAGRTYRYKKYFEYGKRDAFSGMYDHAKWLLLDDIVDCLRQAGFKGVELLESRYERNGPRALIVAQK